MGDVTNQYKILVEYVKERGHFEDLGIDGVVAGSKE
jgi:hypothetical protein